MISVKSAEFVKIILIYSEENTIVEIVESNHLITFILILYFIVWFAIIAVIIKNMQRDIQIKK